MKVRIKFSKQGRLRFVGHLDLMRTFQKINRRAQLPVAYSEGFSPHQIMAFSAPLGMGVEGYSEYCDLKLKDEAEGQITSAAALKALNDNAPEDVRFLSFRKIPDDTKNAMSAVHAADYAVRFLPGKEEPQYAADPDRSTLTAEEAEALSAAAAEFLGKTEVMILRKAKNGKEKEIDLRPMVFSLSADTSGLKMCIAQGSESNLKPDLLLEALFRTEAGGRFAAKRVRIARTELYDAEMRPLESYGETIA